MRLTLIVVACAIWTTMVVRAALSIPPSAIDLLAIIALAIAVTRACIADSRAVGKPMVRSAHFVMLFTWPIAVPMYLLWARRLRGAIVVLAAIGFIIVIGVVGALLPVALASGSP